MDTPQQTPPTIIIQQRESLFGRFGKLLLIALGFCILMLFGMSAAYQQYFGDGEGPAERYHSLNRDANQKIAVIRVVGTIIESNDFVEQQLKKVEKDPSVKAIVLRIDSPGGTVTYSDRLYHKIKELAAEREMPIVVSMGSICASGGYYLAMTVGDQENAIFAEPTTWTGSIGVVIPHYNFSRLMNTYGVVDDSITSGDLKLMGSPTRPMDEKEQKVLQTLVDESFGGFKTIVRSGRPKFREDEEALNAVATGQIFTAGQALERGLVDELGFIEKAIERAAELANLSIDEVRCVKYNKQVTPMQAIMGAMAPVAQPRAIGPNLRGLLELSTPRAYYLCTLTPALLEASN